MKVTSAISKSGVRYAWNTPGMDEKGVALPAYFTKHRFQPLPAGLNQQPSKIAPISALPLKCLTVKKLTGSGRYFGSATARAIGN